MTEDKLDALAQGLSGLHEDLRAVRATVEGHSARFDAIDRKLAGHDGRFNAIDRKLDERGRALAEILRRLPAE